MNRNLNESIQKFIEKFGESELLEYVSGRVEEETTLTVVCDRTMHEIPRDMLLGEVYDFSQGSLDTSSDETLACEIIEKLRLLKVKLKASRWRKVRLIVSGHAVLAPQIKMLVYRILHLETEDFGYFANQGYRCVSINFREDLQ